MPCTYFISNLNREVTVGKFYKKGFQKRNQKEFRVEKVVNKKGDKLHVKWKGFDNWFDGWMNKKDMNF